MQYLIMRKIILILFFISFQIGIINATTNEDEIKLAPKKPNRTETGIPEANHSNGLNQVEIKLKSEQDYSLAIRNENGEIESEYSLITDGIKHSYSLPILSPGVYVIELNSDDSAYEGEILVY